MNLTNRGKIFIVFNITAAISMIVFLYEIMTYQFTGKIASITFTILLISIIGCLLSWAWISWHD